MKVYYQLPRKKTKEEKASGGDQQKLLLTKAANKDNNAMSLIMNDPHKKRGPHLVKLKLWVCIWSAKTTSTTTKREKTIWRSIRNPATQRRDGPLFSGCKTAFLCLLRLAQFYVLKVPTETSRYEAFNIWRFAAVARRGPIAKPRWEKKEGFGKKEKGFLQSAQKLHSCFSPRRLLVG